MKRPDLLPCTLDGKVAKVIEECGEVLQAIGKAGRHGWFATDPKTGIKYDNRADTMSEMNDLRHAMNELEDALNALASEP